jgi:Na+-driven multidrug efflux pump
VLGLFLPAGSGAIPIAIHINDVASWSFVLFGVTLVMFGVVRATGAVFAPLVILAVALFAVRVPFASLLRDRLGADAIWWSFPLAAAVSTVLCIAYYRYGSWRQAQLLPQETTAGNAADTGVSTPAMDAEPAYEAIAASRS